MQVAQLSDDLLARTKHQVIGVAQNDLRASRGQMIRQDAFDGPLRPDRHKRGCIEHAMPRGHPAHPGL